MLELQEQLGLTYLFVAHDLSVVKHISERVAVMYVGRLVEVAKTDEIFYAPRHPYTEALLAAAPIPNPKTKKARVVLKGDVPSPLNPPAGCHFHLRCSYRHSDCTTRVPQYHEISKDHFLACHYPIN